jgi:hypothetical protein
VRLTRVVGRLALALGLGLPACAKPPPRYVERVTADAQGTLWLTGNDGYAARVVGDQKGQCDYPLVRGAPDGSYGHAEIPAARVVIRAGVPYLFTRAGEVYSWASDRWARLPVRFPQGPWAGTQVDEVLLTPQGGWIIHLHATDLLRASHEDLLASKFAVEHLPTYVTSLALLDGRLYGLGWDGSGSRRALRRQEAADRWSTMPLDLSSVHGLIRTPRAEIAVVGDDGLLIVEQEGQAVAPRWQKLLGEGSYFQAPIAVGSRTMLPVLGRDAGLFELQDAGPRRWRFPGATALVVGGFLAGSGVGAVLMTGEVLAPMAGEAVGGAIKEVAR